jgi:hypothetical protein
VNRRSNLAIFTAALVLSLIAHALLISGHWISTPEPAREAPPLLARLEPAPAPPPQVIPLPPPPAQQVAPVRTPRSAAPRVALAPSLSPSLSPFTLPAESAPEPQSAAPEVSPAAAALAPEPIVIADAAPSTLVVEPTALKTLPRRGHIAYALLLGTDRFNVGRTVQTWETTRDSYRMESTSETTGLASAFRSEQRIFRSNGRMTPHGLQPESAQSRRTRRGQTDESTARFDWAQGSITIGSAAGQRTGPLPAGSQDVLSFMYQLSLAPPPAGKLQIAIANGARFENHEFEVAALETLETPLGSIRVLPVRQVRRPGMESLEIWLAAEYRYLPVRIRFIGRNGEQTGEQVVTEIRISEE